LQISKTSEYQGIPEIQSTKDISKLPAAARTACPWACVGTSAILTVESFRLNLKALYL
jgi:hypothetical protein